MKFHLQILLIVGLIVTSFLGCQKDNDGEDSTPPVIEQIQQFWTLENIEDINYEGRTTNVKNREKLNLSPTDYMDFRNDGKVYRKIQDDLDTISYDLKTDNLIELGSEIFSIEVINENSFKLLYEERIDTPYFDNVIELRR